MIARATSGRATPPGDVPIEALRPRHKKPFDY